ncbi:hypothetical protein [Alienimonas chondri]|uniref:Uncharacterized protein n=1 Tax=Alienimonas chondri TaxID=2681879 RepID=A0ABX1VN97_9PLAN|nr:hypothetical protein [Alienimonas chondri]NNJ27886.1 hypothetical protein [Alienimonas chondri]
MQDPTWSSPSRAALGVLTFDPADNAWGGEIAGDGTDGGFDSLTYEVEDPSPGRVRELRIEVAEPTGDDPPAPPSDAAAALAERLATEQTAVMNAALNGFLAETRGDVAGHMWWSDAEEFSSMWDDEVGGPPPTDAAGLRPYFDGPAIVVYDAGSDGLDALDFDDERSQPVAELKFESIIDPEHGVSILLDHDARTVVGTGYQSSATAY